VGAGPDIGGIGSQFGAGSSGKLNVRDELPVASDFVKPEKEESAGAAAEQSARLFFMQMPSHLPLQHYEPPESLRADAGANSASAVDLESDDLREGGEAAAAARMQKAMTAYESHHNLEPIGAYEKLQARREERKRRELEIVESREVGIGVDGWAKRDQIPHAKGECAAPGSYFRQPALPSGKIGKLRIHKSGKVTMKIGDIVCVSPACLPISPSLRSASRYWWAVDTGHALAVRSCHTVLTSHALLCSAVSVCCFAFFALISG